MTAERHPASDSTVCAATTASRDYSDRLDFRLPPFLRLAWATAAARDRWSEPLDRLVEEVRTSEWLSVAAGVRSAAIIVVPRTQTPALVGEWSGRGLKSYIISREDATRVHALNGKTPNLSPSHDVHLVTRRERMEKLSAKWRSPDRTEMAEWLGYPPCCAAFWKTVVVERRYLDTTWAMVEGHIREEKGARIAEIAGAAVNPLLTALGLRATPHRPCGFNCEATQRLATVYSGLRAEAAPQSNPEMLAEVLAWPVEWSSLHGIIEVRLPILKLCYDGDATAATYKVQLIGGALPEHAAQGLGFPHRLPQRSPPRAWRTVASPVEAPPEHATPR
jgi:hypothetical protein